MNAVLKPLHTDQYAVADLSLADWGRKEIRIAESEMPALMAIRDEYAKAQPLKGARITGSLHMTIQTAVLVETLQALGATCAGPRATSSRRKTTPPPRWSQQGTPVFAYKGEIAEGLLGLHAPHLRVRRQGRDGEGPNMILDDGGDATLLMHLGKRAEKDASVIANPKSEEERELYAAIKAKLAVDNGWYTRKARRSSASPRKRPPACTA